MTPFDIRSRRRATEPLDILSLSSTLYSCSTPKAISNHHLCNPASAAANASGTSILVAASFAKEYRTYPSRHRCTSSNATVPKSRPPTTALLPLSISTAPCPIVDQSHPYASLLSTQVDPQQPQDAVGGSAARPWRSNTGAGGLCGGFGKPSSLEISNCPIEQHSTFERALAVWRRGVLPF